jgi:hypothetical protein
MKTLKDLKEHSWVEDYQIVPKEHTHPATQTEIVEVEKLKAEAVEWVRHYRNLNEKDERIADDDRDVRGVKLGANYLVQEWIKHFFNLTEEDIGEEKE